MLPSNSPLSQKGARRSRSNTPSNAASPPDDIPELSDVPCYTCRRRHVKCDRILPNCAKCRKKGVPCLGYQKPLRWADGVAVRGKLKGKSQPVLDSKVINMVRNNAQLQADTALKEAVNLGFHTHETDNCCNDVVADESQMLDLLKYYNSIMCSEHITRDENNFIDRKCAPLSLETARKLPKSVVDCILGIAAVHQASRNPGNLSLERLALETKVNVFQNHNRLLQMPQQRLEQRPDVVICCGILIFAMDLIEHGLNRWMLHAIGSQQVMSSFGGVETLSLYYPHLHVAFYHVAVWEALWITLSHIPLTRPKLHSRRALEMLSHAPLAKQKVFNPCPTPLSLAIWDIGSCAQGIFATGSPISFTDMHKREQILSDILSFQPKEGAKAFREEYFTNTSISQASLQNWEMICALWKAATTIIALRHLYFGRPHLVPQSQFHRSPTPTLATHTSTSFAPHEELGAYYQTIEDFSLSEFVDESSDENIPEFLTAGLYMNDPLSRSPSPLPSPLHYTEPPTSKVWDSRYDIHDEAFAVLAENFAAIHNGGDVSRLRYILVPLLVLALVSRPGSGERALCLSLCAKFKQSMASASAGPIGGEPLEFDIPWEKLDAFSEMVERERRDSMHVASPPMAQSAPEWNWWDMLKHIDLNLAWPVTAGTSHHERGSEFWAFKLLSSVVNDECFNVWLQEPASSQASLSSV